MGNIRSNCFNECINYKIDNGKTEFEQINSLTLKIKKLNDNKIQIVNRNIIIQSS
jgi:hypothetical protein